jgi:hypothetical protein
MRSVLLLVLLAAAGTWVGVQEVPATAEAAQPSLVPVQQIQSVAIDGRGLPLAALRAVLTSHPGDLIDGARLERDRLALEAELAARGHLAARVEPATITYGTDGGAFVMYQIDKGPVFRLRSVTVAGATAREAGVVTLRVGDDALASRIEGARQTLAETLSHRGKATQVTATVQTDAAAGLVDVELSASSTR